MAKKRKNSEEPLTLPSHRMGGALMHYMPEILHGKNDRTLMIVGTAMLEMQIEDILKAFLRPRRRNDQDELFAPDRPLGSLSAKINMLYRLGIYDEYPCKVLDAIREIRNAFAHEVEVTSLNNRPYSDRINDIRKWFDVAGTKKMQHFLQWFRQNKDADAKFDDTPSGYMRALIQRFNFHLMQGRECVRKPIAAWETQGLVLGEKGWERKDEKDA